MFGQRRRGLFDSLSHRLRWYAGYVVAWVESEAFQKATRKRVLDAIRREKPDVLLGHSLGSLVTYNALSHRDAGRGTVLPKVLESLSYVTLGSQIGNAFVVRNLTPGRISALDVNHWYHLYNEEDDVFTAPIRLWDAENFLQVDTFFDIDGWADHDARQYLKHQATALKVWTPIARQARGPVPAARAAEVIKPRAVPKRAPRRRALLIGINDYPDPSSRLDGCVNDVFLMSSVLQECEFQPEQIRTCLNDRATAEGISRASWLAVGRAAAE